MVPQPERGRNILVVEDDDDIREALTLILEDEGYDVESAANGQEALDQLRDGSCADLIVLDLMMPVMDGWQFRSEQQRDPDLAAIPVVIVSADASVKQKAASIGAIDYLRKPIDLEVFLAMVSRHWAPDPGQAAG